MISESEGPAVFTDRSGNLIGHAFRNFGMNFESQMHFRPYETCKVLNDLLSNRACVTDHSGRV